MIDKQVNGKYIIVINVEIFFVWYNLIWLITNNLKQRYLKYDIFFII